MPFTVKKAYNFGNFSILKERLNFVSLLVGYQEVGEVYCGILKKKTSLDSKAVRRFPYKQPSC